MKIPNKIYTIIDGDIYELNGDGSMKSVTEKQSSRDRDQYYDDALRYSLSPYLEGAD